MKKALVPIALVFALIVVAPAAFAAGSANSTLTVNASVVANCTISNGTLTFVGYDPVGANAASPLTSSTPMSVACTKGVTPNITTAAAGGTMTLLPAGPDTLPYTLYSDNGFSNTFVSPGFNMPTAASKATQTLTIYGRIPANQDVAVGSYRDTIQFTVNF